MIIFPAASRIGITHWPTCLSLFSKASALLLNLVLGCNRQAQEIHYLAVSDDMGHKSSNKREPEVETIDKFPQINEDLFLQPLSFSFVRLNSRILEQTAGM